MTDINPVTALLVVLDRQLAAASHIVRAASEAAKSGNQNLAIGRCYRQSATAKKLVPSSASSSRCTGTHQMHTSGVPHDNIEQHSLHDRRGYVLRTVRATAEPPRPELRVRPWKWRLPLCLGYLEK